MIKEIFLEEKSHIDFFFNEMDLTQLETFVELISDCKGTIIFSGIGKSGLSAKKIAVTLTSIGVKSIYLSPSNALHGDIGIVSENDLFVMLSKSGETDELVEIIPYVRNRKVKILSLVCNEKSRIAKASDFYLILPLQKELCPYNMIPTTSTLLQGIIGDVLTVSLMKRKNFNLDLYSFNHPAGRIGKRMHVHVNDLMLKGEELPLCYASDLIVDILLELSNKKSGCILVVDPEKTLIGILTDGDLRRALQKDKENALKSPISKFMSLNPRFIEENVLAWTALKMMESDFNRPITVLPVLENKQVVGLIRMHDILQAGIS